MRGMMLAILTTVLLVSSGWAGDPTQLTMQEMMAVVGPATKPPFILNGWTPHCFGGGKEITCTENPWTTRDLHWGYCLAKMEAAMRAMEPFSVGSIRQIWRDIPSDAYIKLEQTPGFEPRMWDAIRQWHAAKRTCWRGSGGDGG